MNRLVISLAAVLALGTAAVSPVVAQITAVPSATNFQGRLATPSGNPVPDGTYSIRFSLHDALTGGTEKYSKTIANVQVKNGTFAVTLDAFPANTFNGNLWLEVKIGTDAPLTPRTPLVSVPYALKSDFALTVPDGSLTASKFASGVLNANAWLLGGNSGTNPATQFLGTTDTNPLTMKVNNRRVMQYTYFEDLSNANTDFQFRVSNLLGGSEVNSVTPGVYGATIVGGGQDYVTGFDNPNTVTDHFGTVVGGSLNQADGFSFVGGGYNNKATEFYSTIVGGTFNTASNNQTFIGGGISNTASAFGAVVPGGSQNTASGQYATVAGGQGNTASGQYATVGGGFSNLASGFASTVPGGYDNTASGQYSFAAGRRARANHDGAFVWGDSTNADFASTAVNQFLIRANNGVGINTTNPVGFTLYVNGATRTASLTVSGSLTVTGSLHVINLPFGDYRNVQVNGTTGQFYYDNSSRKHKRNITPLVDDFDKLLKAVPMTYTRPNAPGRWEIGFIAEDFDALGLKKLVDYGEGGEVEGINYEKICLYLTAIARKQGDRLTAQEQKHSAEVNALKAKNAELEARLERIEAALKVQK